MEKLVIYVDSLKRDGAERVSVNLARYMSNNNVSCTLLTNRIAQNEYDVPNNVERISIDADKNKYILYFRNIFKMRKILKKIKADTFLIMDMSGCLLGIPSSFGLNMNVVVSERNDPTHFSGKKIVAKVSRFLMSKANGFVFQTQDAKEFYKMITNDKGVVIPNPLFLDTMPPIFSGNRLKEIVSVGRLTNQKNQKLLLNAFSLIHHDYPEFKLIIYGEGELKDELIKEANNLGIGNKVIFPGNKKDVLKRINGATIFIMSSDFEGMPNALLEAMALGLPCISTDCPIGGPRSVIENNKNGILTSVGNYKEMANAIDKLLSNPDLASSIGKNASKIRKQLDSNLICKKWKEYLDLIN